MAPGRTASSVGMMEGAFFVSRTELLQWVNTLLQVNLTKVEQCANGAVYCQILDACHPGTVAMRKVNWLAKTDHEFIPNYKVLQSAFDKNKIDKHIEVDRLIRAKYQDNLEFLQWMKCYWDRECGGAPGAYPAGERREGRPLPPGWACASSGAAARGAVMAAARGTVLQKENRQPVSTDSAAKRPVKNGFPATTAVGSRARAAGYPAASADVAREQPIEDASFNSVADTELEELRSKTASLQREKEEIHESLSQIEEERDFYYQKLRDVEILCQNLQEHVGPADTAEKVLADVLEILYANDGEAADTQAP